MNRAWSDHRHHFWDGVWGELDDIAESGDVLAGMEFWMHPTLWDMKPPVSLLRRDADGVETWVDCFLA